MQLMHVMADIDSWICVYCGQKLKNVTWNIPNRYHCDCSDTKKLKAINDEIEKLEKSRPQPKYNAKGLISKKEE